MKYEIIKFDQRLDFLFDHCYKSFFAIDWYDRKFTHRDRRKFVRCLDKLERKSGGIAFV